MTRSPRLAGREQSGGLCPGWSRSRSRSAKILLATYLLVAYAGAFAGFGEEGIGLANDENADDVLTIVGEPVPGAILTSVLLLTVACRPPPRPRPRSCRWRAGALAMAVYKAIPAKFAEVHPRYKTPGFAILVMGATAVGFYLILSLISTNALADSIASLGLTVAFYYGITAFSCVVYFRRTLFTSARNLFLRGLLPLLGVASAWWWRS